MSRSKQILRYFQEMERWRFPLPAGIEWLFPYAEPGVMQGVRSFYERFFSDEEVRIPLFGINPGRFGAGSTGIAFTDPVCLEQDCGIPNLLPKRTELSSIFIYDMIRAYGGAEAFYSRYFIGALYPLGFTRQGRNINYYDDKELMALIRPAMMEHVSLVKRLCGGPRRAYCIGEGKNYEAFRKLNEEAGFFREIIPLPHPRWVMQYRFRTREEYVRQYLEALSREMV